MEHLLNVAENFSARVNLLYASVGYILFSSYWNSFLSGAGFFTFLAYVIYYTLIVAILALLVVGTFSGLMYLFSWQQGNPNAPVDWSKYIECKDAHIQKEFAGKKIPMETFVESYLKGDCDVKGDIHDILRNNRKEVFQFAFTKGHLEFFLKKFTVQTLNHSKLWDAKDVTSTYDLGNDFYNWFLGPSMVYTCATFNNVAEETLEEAQRNKIDLVCKKIDLHENETHLDIGCGWGTFVAHAAQHYGSDSLGITISKEQIEWGMKRIADLPAEARNRAKVELMDYRDIPKNRKWKKITCLEMAEHVGVKNFQKFCRQLYGILEDDGALYIQMCGLRPSWQFEDLVWGLFMAKYIFPGADSSCPLGWVCQQLEKAGFEVRMAETVTYHYGVTIKRWYDNWVKNKAAIVKAYGQKQWRLYYLFLGWSVLIAEQGSSACYQIVAHKNLGTYDRSRAIGKVGVPSTFIGGNPPVTQIPTDALKA